MSSKVEDIAAGTVGHFWAEPPHDRDLSSADSGHVKLDELNRFETTVLITHKGWEYAQSAQTNGLPRTPTLYAMTHASGAFFFDLAAASQSPVFGATRAWTETKSYRGVVAGIPLDEIASGKFTEVSLTFSDVHLWSRMLAIKSQPELHPDGRASGFTVHSRESPKLTAKISKSIELEITSKWNVTGQDDSLLISSPMVVTSRSKRPVDWQDHVVHLLSVRDLLNLGYHGFVVASSGSAVLDYLTTERRGTTPEFWSGRFMAAPAGVDPAKTRGKPPTFSLRSLGGMRAVKSWIALDKAHPRATGPLISRYRMRTMGVEIRLIELAAAIEYWTRVNQELKRRWADPVPIAPNSAKNKPWPTAMALKAGPEFSKFVGGDVDRWVAAFWGAYTSLKHHPNYQYDSSKLDLLATSGEVLLLGSLLARCTGSRAIIENICLSSEYHNDGYRLRKLLKSGGI